MACNAFTGGGAALQGLARRRFRGRHDCGGERGIRTPDTLAGTPDFESGAFSRSASSPELTLHTSTAKSQAQIDTSGAERLTRRWRRGWDSNPRYVSVYTLSKRAPSAARPPLQT